MTCRKCKGRVFMDTLFSSKSIIELYCLMCGKRWNLSSDKDEFAKWLTKLVPL